MTDAPIEESYKCNRNGPHRCARTCGWCIRSRRGGDRGNRGGCSGHRTFEEYPCRKSETGVILSECAASQLRWRRCCRFFWFRPLFRLGLATCLAPRTKRIPTVTLRLQQVKTTRPCPCLLVWIWGLTKAKAPRGLIRSWVPCPVIPCLCPHSRKWLRRRFEQATKPATRTDTMHDHSKGMSSCTHETCSQLSTSASPPGADHSQPNSLHRLAVSISSPVNLLVSFHWVRLGTPPPKLLTADRLITTLRI